MIAAVVHGWGWGIVAAAWFWGICLGGTVVTKSSYYRKGRRGR